VQLKPYKLDRIVTSVEPKAVETGELAARRLGIPCQAAANLHEHERESAPYFETRAAFYKAIRNLFAHPDKLIFGDETGLEARERFEKAVEATMVANPRENIAIVTHGTVLSLFVSHLTGCEIYPFWQKLGMPAILAFSYPRMKLLTQVNEIV
jgi:broad specificity phosphatase PhoE